RRAHRPPGRARVRGVAGPFRGLSRAMAGQRSRIRRRREQLETMLAGGQARLDRGRLRSMVVDTMVGGVRRERPVAIGILAASLALPLFRGRGGAGLPPRPGGRRRPHSGRRPARPGGVVGGRRQRQLAAGPLAGRDPGRVRPPAGRRRRARGTALGPPAGLADDAVAVAGPPLAGPWPCRRGRGDGRRLGPGEQARADAKGLATEVTVVLVTAGAQAALTAPPRPAPSAPVPPPPRRSLSP